MTTAESIAVVTPALRRMARKYASRGLDAEDLYQEGVLRAWKQRPPEGQEYPPSYIVRRARFAMIDALRVWASDSRRDGTRMVVVWRCEGRSLEREMEIFGFDRAEDDG